MHRGVTVHVDSVKLKTRFWFGFGIGLLIDSEVDDQHLKIPEESGNWENWADSWNFKFGGKIF